LSPGLTDKRLALLAVCIADEPQFERDKFTRTAANARAAGVWNVRPTVSLGTSYHRNISQQPNLNHGGHDRDHPFFNVIFDMAGNAGGTGYAYDLAFSSLLGAQINDPRFNSTGEYSAFGPWEQSVGGAFYPGVFSLVSAPSPVNKVRHPPRRQTAIWNHEYLHMESHMESQGSSIVMDHFVAYVEGATTNVTVGPFGR